AGPIGQSRHCRSGPRSRRWPGRMGQRGGLDRPHGGDHCPHGLPWLGAVGATAAGGRDERPAARHGGDAAFGPVHPWAADLCGTEKERYREAVREKSMTSGIHHVTLITGNVQANVDFFVGFLGLRLVKRTKGYEDARQLHLFYGDYNATPGSLITYLVWEGGSAGQAGAGQVSELALAIAPGSIGFWIERALRFGVKNEGTGQEFGETVLRLRDSDGVLIKLVSADLPALDMPRND